MRKNYSFMGLVGNEYIKIYKKLSAKILLGLFILAVIAVPVLLKVINISVMNEMQSYVLERGESGAQIVHDRLMGLGEEERVYMDIKEDLANSLADKTFSPGSWLHLAASTAMGSTDKQEIQRLAIYCKTGDWRGYYTYLEEKAVTDGEKWELRYRIEHELPQESFFYYDESGIETVIDKVRSAKDTLQFSQDNEKAKADLLIGQYQLEKDHYINTAEYGSLMSLGFEGKANFWQIYMLTPKLVLIVGVVMIVIAGGIVASEFSQGTIKFLLINPVKRWKILCAKYFTVISLGLFMMIVMALLSIPTVGLLFGFEEIGAPYLTVKNGAIAIGSPFLQVIKNYLLSSISMVVMATLAFCLSSLVRSSALAIGISLAFTFLGTNIVTVLAQFGLDWARYLIFANTDISAISAGNSLFPQHTVAFAVAVIAAHMAAFLLTAWDGFTKRSV